MLSGSNKGYTQILRLWCSLVRLKHSLQTMELQLEAGPQPIKHTQQCAETHTCTAYWRQLFLSFFCCVRPAMVDVNNMTAPTLTHSTTGKRNRRAAFSNHLQMTVAIAKLLT